MEKLLDPDPHNGSSLFFLMFDTQSTGNTAMIDKWNPFKPKNCFLAKKIINKVKGKKKPYGMEENTCSHIFEK